MQRKQDNKCSRPWSNITTLNQCLARDAHTVLGYYNACYCIFSAVPEDTENTCLEAIELDFNDYQCLGTILLDNTIIKVSYHMQYQQTTWTYSYHYGNQQQPSPFK